MRSSPKTISFLSLAARVTLLLSVAGVILLAAAWWASNPKGPDSFYDAPKQRASERGQLLSSQPFSRDIPANSLAWRILYSTTRADNTYAVASAIVVIAKQPASGPRPVVAWAHGTTGIARGCAPSVMGHPFANVPALDELLRQNWVYVATDYVGLGTAGGHAYLIGDDAARAVLDSVRAARQLKQINIDGRVVVWGHSQGGNSALWTGIRAHDYAPDLQVMGIAALAPASDLKALVAIAQSSMFEKIVSSYLIRSYSTHYSDIDLGFYVRRSARLLVDDIAGRCVGDWSTLFSLLETGLLPRDGIFAQDTTRGPLATRLIQNTPLGRIPMPLMIAQGQKDDLVSPEIQHRFVNARCADGQPIDFRLYAGLDHLSLVAAGSPLGGDLISWTRDRLAGRPAPENCGH